MEMITKDDLELINHLYSRKYENNSILSNASEDERFRLLSIRKKLKKIANYYSDKYALEYGPFETEMSTGNPVAQSKALNNVWAGLFKGNSNKQYAAQISFVINRSELCLDVGFYFGRASARSLSANDRQNLEQQFVTIGRNLSQSLNLNQTLQKKYDALFDFGFKPLLNSNPTTPFEWRIGISEQPQASQIVAKIFPNSFGIIENSIVDSFVSQVIFLMGFINEVATPFQITKPFTPEQYVKQAERFAEIGLKGELHIMELERKKLERIGIITFDYPRHVALESNAFGYDSLSLDENENEIYIEVKSTTRNIEDIYSRSFHLSKHEHNTFINNKNCYKLARVYNVEMNPHCEYLNLDNVNLISDGFIIEY